MRKINNKVPKKFVIIGFIILSFAILFLGSIKSFHTKSTSIYDKYTVVLKEYLEKGYFGFGAHLVDIDGDDMCELAIILDDSHNSLVSLYSISRDGKRVVTICDNGLGSDGYLEYSTKDGIIISSYYGALRNGGNYEIIDLYRIDYKKLSIINSLRKEQDENGDFVKAVSNGNVISEEEYNEIYYDYVLSKKIKSISYSSAFHIYSLDDVEEFLSKRDDCRSSTRE